MDYLLLLFINDQFIPPAKTLDFEQCRMERADILYDYDRLANVMCFGKVVVFCRREE